MYALPVGFSAAPALPGGFQRTLKDPSEGPLIGVAAVNRAEDCCSLKMAEGCRSLKMREGCRSLKMAEEQNDPPNAVRSIADGSNADARTEPSPKMLGSLREGRFLDVGSSPGASTIFPKLRRPRGCVRGWG